MKKFNRLALTITTLALPLTTILTIPTTIVSAQTTDSGKVKYTYTGNGPVKKLKKTAYHSKDSTGNIYSALFMADQPKVHLTKKTTLDQYRTTWYVTKEMSVSVGKNKSRTYYYVTSSNGKVAGWTWKGYLYKGIFQSAD